MLSRHVHGGRSGWLKDEHCFVEGNAGEKEKRRREEREKCDVLRILSVVSLAASTPSLFFARDLSLGQQTGQSVKVVAGIVFDLQAAALSLLDDPDLGVQLVG
jgi:hypothetical protein